MWFKSCPRCQSGDIALEAERDGCRIRCVQCAFSRDFDNPYQAAVEADRLIVSRRFMESLA